ncbi:hypothetical protein [Litchfieldia salsa]|uniref:Uncharacterized protein n=1 Tax=Litchfieldia salsa TaxID=930152 RepID=A0A1H0PN54_9BACI|nr:hypothetical protein [Litchfieldia salsa]SDP06016.1 hypothetical protein SAMN05216565_101376 [Litchfieldia salsa]
MKIEMGESLISSWLRHVRVCQSVQTNWKPSSAWSIQKEDRIKYIMEQSSRYFSDKHNLNIFKNTKSHTQLLKQGEIDVLGIEISNGDIATIYGVDIAFHENGLNYGGSTQTVEKIMKKMIRTAMMLYAYFNVTSGKIIFASPKIHKSQIDLINSCIIDLKGLFQSLSLDFDFILYANESFDSLVLQPVLDVASSVADTSELFMRSIQMYNMFNTNKEESTRTTSTLKSSPKPVLDLEELEEIKVGELVQKTMHNYARENKLSQEKVQFLCDSKYSKRTFDINYPFLIKIKQGIPLDQQGIFNGYNRYWKNPINFNDERYLMCSQWYDKNKTRFIKWMEEISQNR